MNKPRYFENRFLIYNCLPYSFWSIVIFRIITIVITWKQKQFHITFFPFILKTQSAGDKDFKTCVWPIFKIRLEGKITAQ